jgi:hypothetical protein
LIILFINFFDQTLTSSLSLVPFLERLLKASSLAFLAIYALIFIPKVHSISITNLSSLFHFQVFKVLNFQFFIIIILPTICFLLISTLFTVLIANFSIHLYAVSQLFYLAALSD